MEAPRVVPIFDERHGRAWREQIQLAHSPALAVNAFLRQFDGRKTLAGKSLQWCKHGTPH